MGYIIAKGIYEGMKLEVVCVERENRLSFLFNKHQDPVKLNLLREEMKKRHPIAGTYIPDKEDMLNVLNVFKYYFFDDPPEIEATGITEEMPWEDGVVY